MWKDFPERCDDGITGYPAEINTRKQYFACMTNPMDK